MSFLNTLLTQEGNEYDQIVAKWAEDNMEFEDEYDGSYLGYVE